MNGQRTPNGPVADQLIPLQDLVGLVRSWLNHWAEVERITSDFPEDIKRVLAVRPIDPAEALEQTRAQFAVLFHPEATANFVIQLEAVLRTVEAFVEAQRPVEAD